MTIRFEGVSIIGVGLLGASLGLAVREQNMASRVIGIGRNSASLDIALQRGAVDTAVTDVAEGVSQSDLVVISTPASVVIPMLDRVLEAAPATALIVDVASTKGSICAHARKVCRAPRRFVGCHPMAGAEVFGPQHGRADFYRGSVCLVEEDESISQEARAGARGLWEGVGARVVEVDVQQHDAILARTSHAPHVTAAALALAADAGGASASWIGNGFRDATRIAASRSEIWRDICLENRDALLEALRILGNNLAQFEALLTEADEQGIEAFFEAGAAARRKVMEA